jgi:hypothetical protein
MMMNGISLLLLLLVGNIYNNQDAILECDFESNCFDFILDSSWNITIGLPPKPIDDDHTLNTILGKYLLYNPILNSFASIAQNKSSKYLQLLIDQVTYSRIWYLTSPSSLYFTLQLVQSDDEQLARIITTINDGEPLLNE